jgi:hypothetical protein
MGINVEALAEAVRKNRIQLEHAQRDGVEPPELEIPSIHLIC